MKRKLILIVVLFFAVYYANTQSIGWCNLQFPSELEILNNQTFNVYAVVYAEGVTEGVGAGAGIEAWIGVSTENTNPENWTIWIPAYFNVDSGNNDEYMAVIGPLTAGMHYFASRFQLNGGDFYYGGYDEFGGNFWDGINYVSGIVTVTDVLGSTCENPLLIEMPTQSPLTLDNQSTCGMVNMYNQTCLNTHDAAQDIIYKIILSEAAVISISMNPNGTSRTGIALYNGCPDNGECITYFYDNTSNIRNISAPLQPGEYYIIVDQFIIMDDCIPDFSLEISAETDACLSPQNLMVFVENGNDAIVTWTPGLGETQWELLYGAKGFDVDTEGILLTEDVISPYTISGLEFFLFYDVYLRAVCNEEEVSEWSEFFTFNTCVEVVEFPWKESFEEDSEYIECWSQEMVIGNQQWTFENGANGGAIASAKNGVKNARFYKHSSELLVTKLVSPLLDISELVDPVLSFWYAQQLWDEDQNELKVYYRTEPNEDWIELAHLNENISVWTKLLFEIPVLSETFQLAFEGIHNYGRANVIDDVSIRSSIDIPLIHEIDIHNQVENITVLVGTSLENAILLLPEHIFISDTDGDEYIVNLDWTIPGYDSNIVGQYEAKGIFSLPVGMLQTNPETTLEVTATVNVELEVGIEINTNLGINIYPNPNSGVFVLDAKGFEKTAEYSIYDIRGKIIYKGSLLSNEQAEISLDLSKGIYFVKLSDGENIKIQKMIIE